MNVALSNRSVRQYGKLPAVVQARFDKQLKFLLSNLRHPSLRAKKYDEATNVWQARVNDHFRFYFQIHGNTYRILRVRSTITSQNGRPDLRQIRLRPIEQDRGIAGLFRGSAIEERPKMA